VCAIFAKGGVDIAVRLTHIVRTMTDRPSLEPAATIISRFGGPDKVQEITKASRTRVYRWTQPKEAGGTGGLIPMVHAVKLIDEARRTGIEISLDDFSPASRAPETAA
jgi:hypothetical protein